jgi:hypothetical protein
VRRDAEGLDLRIAVFERSMREHLPPVFEQLCGLAEGTGLPLSDILALNLPMGVGGWMVDPQCCTNMAFTDGPDGPLWGKNNDGGFPPATGPVRDARGPRPVALLKLYPDDGVPALCVSFCGWLSGGDMMNAAGVAVGHSSVGSRFAQNPAHVSVLHWMYWLMLTSRTGREYACRLTERPVYGKGFSQLVVDRGGVVVSAEVACPLVQLRWANPEDRSLNCVNHYQLPALEGRDARTPVGLANSKARQALLERLGSESDRSVAHMQSILRYHGEPSVCRHGGDDLSHTEYSMIGITRDSRMLIADGNPCTHPYRDYSIA